MSATSQNTPEEQGDTRVFDLARQAIHSAGFVVLDLERGGTISPELVASGRDCLQSVRRLVGRLDVEGVIEVASVQHSGQQKQNDTNPLALLDQQEATRPAMMRLLAVLEEARDIAEGIDDARGRVAFSEDLEQMIASVSLDLYGPMKKTKRRNLTP
jgi:hypothetical protein